MYHGDMRDLRVAGQHLFHLAKVGGLNLRLAKLDRVDPKHPRDGRNACPVGAIV